MEVVFMKKIYKTVLLFLVCTSLFAQNANQSKEPVTFESHDLQGAPLSEKLFSQNKLTMINIWATFCGPCIKEMPDLEKLSQSYAAKGVKIIGIPVDSTDNTGKLLEKQKAILNLILEKTGVTYPQLIPNKSVFHALLQNVQVVPTTLFFDEKGKQIGEVCLGSKNYKEWEKIILSLLEKN